MKGLVTAVFAGVAAAPAMAAGDYPFFSLANTDLVVLMAFVIFIGVLVYFKVPEMVTGLLDKRADGIREELEKARELREEALALRASFERRQVEVKEQAERIVSKAREDAQIAADAAKAEIEATIARRLKAAEDQIASAEAAAVRSVRNKAARIAIQAAGDVIAAEMTAQKRSALIGDAIKTVEARLN